MKVLVTGGSGFIGGHIVQECEKRGYYVTAYDLIRPSYMCDAEYVEGDITKPLQLNDFFDIVFHCAGSLGTHTTFNRIESTFNINIDGMINLMQWVKRNYDIEIDNDYIAEKVYQLTYRKPRIVNCGLIRDWSNPYMISKHAASKIGLMYKDRYGVDFLDVRMTVVYGPRQGWYEEKVVPTFILNSLKGKELNIYGDGSSLMNMMYVKDVVKILVDCVINDDIIKVDQIDLANPAGDISVIDFANIVKKTTGSKSDINYVPMRPGQPGNVDVKYNLNSMYEALYCFRSLEEGLVDTIGWYKGMI